MKARRVAKTFLATFAFCSMLQFSQPSLVNTEEIKKEQETVLIDESSNFKNSYNHLKNEFKSFLKGIQDNNTKRSKKFNDNMERIYSSAIFNEEIGLGIAFFKYKHREDLAYLVLVNTDYLQTRGVEDKFKLLGNPIVTFDRDDLDSELEERCEQAKDFIRYDSIRITDGPKVEVLDGVYIASNIHEFDEIKNGETIYFGIPFFEKGKGCGKLFYSLGFKTVEGKVLVEGRGEGGIVLEGLFYETETL